jgi:hypothetical protein
VPPRKSSRAKTESVPDCLGFARVDYQKVFQARSLPNESRVTASRRRGSAPCVSNAAHLTLAGLLPAPARTVAESSPRRLLSL